MGKFKQHIVILLILTFGFVGISKVFAKDLLSKKEAFIGRNTFCVDTAKINPAQKIPFPETLRKANIKSRKLDSPILHGMIQGNGDLHSFFYAKKKQIIVRLAKNDVYDARIDTKDDPELARIDIETGKVSRELTLPPSWRKTLSSVY